MCNPVAAQMKCQTAADCDDMNTPGVPASCAKDFQLTDASSTFVYELKALDIATYTGADGVQITGVDGNCKK